ncbi:MAG: outer membrane protein transport protein [Pseudomonadota bacterium]
MKKFAHAAAALLATTGLVQAGGIDRAVGTTSILFESGTYVELGYTFVDPEVSGTAIGASSGDMAPSFGTGFLRFHNDINEQLSFSFIIDQPIGADVDYPVGTGYAFAGSTAEISATQFTAALRYEMDNHVSVYGGPRVISVDGTAFVNTAAFAYDLDVSNDIDFGFMVGAAFERPEIALRVALTYFSEIELNMNGVEGAGAAGTAPSALPDVASVFDVTLPQSLLLEAQSGIAEGTLLFGSVRWTEWTEFLIDPALYPPTSALVDYEGDIFTYQIGLARQLNENWSVAGSLTYEEAVQDFPGNLGPTDGLLSLGLGAEYTQGNMSIAGGVQYTWLEDTSTIVSQTPFLTSSFTDNNAIAASIRVGFQF